MHRHHEEVRDQFRPLGLEMVLGHPERVVAALVHALGIGHDLVHHAGQLLLRIAALVDRRALVTELLHVDGAVIGAVEFRDHRWGPCAVLLRLSRSKAVSSSGNPTGRL